MLEGLSHLLGSEFEIVGTARNGRVLLIEAERLRPDVIVLDVAMPELNGIEAARRLSQSLPSAKLVFVTQQLDPAYLHAAFSAGAMGYVAKQSASTELVSAIRRALQFEMETPGAFAALQFENPANPDFHEETTAVEIWEQMEGRVDAWISTR